MKGRISLVGIGDDGCLSLSSRSINEIACAEVLAGASRQLEFFPQFEGETICFTQGLDNYIAQILEQATSKDICVLASGDPLFYGLGSRIVNAVLNSNQAIEVEIFPNVSSVQLACAKTLISSNQIQTLSLHGRPLRGLIAAMQQYDEIALLTDTVNNPIVIANYLNQFDESGWRIWVCENLGGVTECVREFSLATLIGFQPKDFSTLNVMLLKRDTQAYWGGHSLHSPDSSYQMRTPVNGLITKASVRAVAISRLGLHRKSIMWDVGSGSGSIAIEAAKLAYQGQVFAIECNPDCMSMIESNIARHRVDNVSLIAAKAPQGLATLPSPDCVFVGGTRGEVVGIIDSVIAVLANGGKLVLSAVTLDSVQQFYQLCQQRDYRFEILLLQHSHSQALAQYQRYQADNPIHLFIITKEDKA